MYIGFVFVATKSHKTGLKQRNFHRTFTLKYFKSSLKKKHLCVKLFCVISISLNSISELNLMSSVLIKLEDLSLDVY